MQAIAFSLVSALRTSHVNRLGCEEAHRSAFFSACFPLARRGAPVAPFARSRLHSSSPGNSAPDSEVQLLVLSSAPCLALPADLDTMLTRFTLGCSMRMRRRRRKPRGGGHFFACCRQLRRSLPVDELRQLLMRLRNLLTRHGPREKELLAALAPRPRNLLRFELSFGLNRLQRPSSAAGPTCVHETPPHRPSTMVSRRRDLGAANLGARGGSKSGSFTPPSRERRGDISEPANR